MPGHGKTGPERDFVAYGTNDRSSSPAWRTSAATKAARRTRPASPTPTRWPESPPREPRAGALGPPADRSRQSIELAQRENMISVIGEFVVAFSMNGREPERRETGTRRWRRTAAIRAPATTMDHDRLRGRRPVRGALWCLRPRRSSPDDARFADVVSRYRNQRRARRDHRRRGRGGGRRTSAAETLQAAGVPAMPVLSVPEVFEDEHLRAREFFETVSHAVAGAWDIEASTGG